MCHNSRVTELPELVIILKKATKNINQTEFANSQIHMYNLCTQIEFQWFDMCKIYTLCQESVI